VKGQPDTTWQPARLNLGALQAHWETGTAHKHTASW